MEIAGLPWWLSGKEFTCSAGDVGRRRESERSPRGGNGQRDPPEEEMVTHSSIFAWNTPIPRVTKELDD